MNIEEKLQGLGIVISEPSKPLGYYTSCKVFGNLVFVSGVIPIKEGNIFKGRFGENLCVEDSKKIAKLVVASLVSNIKSQVGDLEKISSVIKIEGYVNSTPDFVEHPKVLNEVSELLVKIFGENGIHSRIAVGVSSLPLGACMEVSGIFSIGPSL